MEVKKEENVPEIVIKTEVQEDAAVEDVRLPSLDIGCNFSNPKERAKIEEQAEFYFESDHLALKGEGLGVAGGGGGDYHTLLRTLVMLEAQKVQAVQDVELLLQVRAQARSSPLDLVSRLQRGEGLGLPGPQEIAPLPVIDWTRYHIQEDPKDRKLQTKRTVRMKEKFGSLSRLGNRKQKELEGDKSDRKGGGEYLVRGRVFQTHKPVTFNQPWTREEQQMLEELLERFPTEETEMERWKKIASEMGNRTPVQVQSRVQKYFLKLHRAGLPIPGRLPPQRNKNRYFSPGSKRRVSGAPVLAGRRTTFLTSVVPSVVMEEEEEEEREEGHIETGGGEETSDSDEEWPTAVRNTPEYRELRWLLRVRQEKEVELNQGTVEHMGYTCARCGQTPILGTRWQCQTCPQISLCNDCVVREWTAGNHIPAHNLRPVREVGDGSDLRDTEYS